MPAPRSDIIPRASGWKLHTPNALVGVRLALSVGVFAILAVHRPGETGSAALLIAAGLFILAAATDALDGFLARRWNAITRFGRVMDPFADKILVLGSFVLLAGPGFWTETQGQISGFTGWMVILIIARELLITSLRGLLEGSGSDFSAQTAGKIKMVLQSVAVPAVLVTLALHRAETPSVDPASVGPAAINAAIAWATTLVTLASGIPYIRAAARSAAGEQPPNA